MSTLTTTGQRLTAAEAESLWRKWKVQRDQSARDSLILAYAPMVRYLASRKVRELPAHCELDDLASCGLVALMEAVDRFDPVKGATFEQYAWTRVSGAIMDELRRQDWASRSVRRVGRRIERAHDAYVAKHGVVPAETDLARELQMEVTELRDRLEEIDRADVVSLNAPARGSEDSLPVEVGDTLQARTGEHEPERQTLSSERAAVVRRAIAGLSERERKVLTLVHVHELQGAEIGRMLGVSESRVSQILAGIRRKLKEQVAAYEATGEYAA